MMLLHSTLSIRGVISNDLLPFLQFSVLLLASLLKLEMDQIISGLYLVDTSILLSTSVDFDSAYHLPVTSNPHKHIYTIAHRTPNYHILYRHLVPYTSTPTFGRLCIPYHSDAFDPIYSIPKNLRLGEDRATSSSLMLTSLHCQHVRVMLLSNYTHTLVFPWLPSLLAV